MSNYSVLAPVVVVISSNTDIESKWSESGLELKIVKLEKLDPLASPA